MDIMMQVAIVLLITLVFIGLLIAFIVFIIRGLVLSKKNWRKRIENHHALTGAQLFLVSGLPLAEETYCEIFVGEQNLCIEAHKQTFNVPISNIIAAQAKTDVEIEKEVTSSAGKAVVGGLLFGSVGAIVGGRVKTKKTKTFSYYLIINYKSQNGATEVLAFKGQSKGCNDISSIVTQQMVKQKPVRNIIDL